LNRGRLGVEVGDSGGLEKSIWIGAAGITVGLGRVDEEPGDGGRALGLEGSSVLTLESNDGLPDTSRCVCSGLLRSFGGGRKGLALLSGLLLRSFMSLTILGSLRVLGMNGGSRI